MQWKPGILISFWFYNLMHGWMNQKPFLLLMPIMNVIRINFLNIFNKSIDYWYCKKILLSTFKMEDSNQLLFWLNTMVLLPEFCFIRILWSIILLFWYELLIFYYFPLIRINRKTLTKRKWKGLIRINGEMMTSI